MPLNREVRGESGRISIAMATYNGAAHLRAQVESLFGQSRMPDELVVHDDASSDGTQQLLLDIAEQAPFPVRILQADRNHGVNAAFGTALRHCRGDIVFFCDQDDIWHPEKVKACLDALDQHPEAAFVFSDASQFTGGCSDLSQSLWQLSAFSPARQVAFRRSPLETMLKGGNFVYGMASAFRRNAILPFARIDCDPIAMTHDTWFSLHTVAMGATGIALPQRLVRYRRHAAQTSVVLGGVAAFGDAGRQRAQLRAARLIAALLTVRSNVEREGRSQGIGVTSSLAHLDRKIAFLQARENLRRDRRLASALKAIANPDYWHLAKGPASVLRDYRGIW
jgi:glycosyltransferase involved in cell wall biosynthesis